MTNKGCPPKDPNFLRKHCGGEAQLPRGYCARRNHVSKDKFQIKEFTVNQEISEKKTATTTLNALHLTN